MDNPITRTFVENNIAFYWGILAESTQSKGQRIFHVYVPDLNPLRNGDISDKGSVELVKLFNVITHSWEEINVQRSRTVIAEYLGSESSRDVPDMYKGQQVILMTYCNYERWFWIPLERDDYIKPFEHVKFKCADLAAVHKLKDDSGNTIVNEEKERSESLTDDNTYFLEIDTKYNKHVLISTSSSDGEIYRYFFKINTNEHSMELWDCKADPVTGECAPVPHNSIKIESAPPGLPVGGRISMKNEAGSCIILDGPNILINALGNMIVTTGGNHVTQVHGSRSIMVFGNEQKTIAGNLMECVLKAITKEVRGLYSYLFKQSRSETVALNYNRVVGGATIEQTGSLELTALASYKVNSPNITITGSLSTVVSGKSMVVGKGISLSLIASNRISTNREIHRG